MLYRKFYEHSNSSTLLKLYLTTIRPHLEYASPVWNPHHRNEINQIERVQKFAIRMCLKSWNSNYDDLLHETHVVSLNARRTQASIYVISTKLSKSKRSIQMLQ